MPRQGDAILSDLIAPTLTLVCAHCERKGVNSVASLVAKHSDARLTDLRSFLTADCPNRAKFSIHAQCDAKSDPPPENEARAADVVSHARAAPLPHASGSPLTEE